MTNSTWSSNFQRSSDVQMYLISINGNFVISDTHYSNSTIEMHIIVFAKKKSLNFDFKYFGILESLAYLALAQRLDLDYKHIHIRQKIIIIIKKYEDT